MTDEIGCLVFLVTPMICFTVYKIFALFAGACS